MLARRTVRFTNSMYSMNPMSLRLQLSASFIYPRWSMHYPSYTALPLLRRNTLITTRSFSKSSSSSLPAELASFAAHFKSLKTEPLPGPLKALANKLFFRGIQVDVRSMDFQKADILLQILHVAQNPLSNDFVTMLLKWDVADLVSFYEIYSKFNTHCDGVIHFYDFIGCILKIEKPKLFFNLINALAAIKSEFYIAYKLFEGLRANEGLLNKVQACTNLQAVLKLIYLMDIRYHKQIVSDEERAEKILEIIEDDCKQNFQKYKKSSPIALGSLSKPSLSFQEILIYHFEDAQDVKRLADMIGSSDYKLVHRSLLILKKDDVWFEFIDQYQYNPGIIRDYLAALLVMQPQALLPAFNLAKKLPALKNDIFKCFYEQPELAENIFHTCKTIISGTDINITPEEFALIYEKARKVGVSTGKDLVKSTAESFSGIRHGLVTRFFKIVPNKVVAEETKRETFTL